MQTREYGAMFRSEERLWWYVALRDAVRSALGRYVRPGAEILDAGCGTGKNSEFLRSLGYAVRGAVDPSLHAVEFSRQRGLPNLARGSMVTLPFAGESFDAAVCLDVLGILDDEPRRRAVADLYRVLRPGGILVVHASALEFLRSQHDDVINWRRRFTRSELRELLLENTGGRSVELLRLSYRVTALFPAVAAVKLLKKATSRGEAPTAQADHETTPPLINRCLTTLTLAENRILDKADLPIGSSLFAVVRAG